MSTITPPVAPPRPQRRRKVIAAVTIGAVALLGVGTAVAVPAVVHAAQVDDYHAVLEDLEQTQAVIADEALRAELTMVLTVQVTEEAHSLQDALAELAKAKDPVLTSKTTKAFGESAADLATALESGEVSTSATELAEQVYSELEADATPVVSWFASTPDSLNELLGREPEPAEVVTVPDDEVDGDTLDRAQAELATVQQTADTATQVADEGEAELNRIKAAVAATLPVLKEAAGTVPTQAKVVVEKASKSGKYQKLTTAAASAAHAASIADQFVTDQDGALIALAADSESPAEQTLAEPGDAEITVLVQQKLTEYVKAAKSAQSAHAKKVKAEKAAAAAAAAAAEAAARANASRNYTGGGGGGSSSGGGTSSGGGSSSSGGGGGGSYTLPPQPGGIIGCPPGMNCAV